MLIGHRRPLRLIDANASIPAKATTTVLQDGSTDPFYHPAPMDFFRTALPLAPVTVRLISMGTTSVA